MGAPMASAFSLDTAVRRLGAGRYAADLSDSWNLRPLPQGGIVTAVTLRAMAEELADPGQRLRGLHTSFVGQVAHGPLELTVETLRRGRSMSHVRGEVRNPGAASGHVTTAAFGAPRRGFSFTDLEPPEAPPPGACRSYRDPPPAGVPAFEPMPFWDRCVEGRGVLGHASWEDYEPGRAETVQWFGFDEPPLRDDGTLDPLALVVLADVMPGAVAEKMGRAGRLGWFAPSVDLTVHLLEDCRSGWVLAHNRARFAGDGYASAEMALWDRGASGTDASRLVAYATQVFLFSFLD
jgi:acyl-CoA thioesterase